MNATLYCNKCGAPNAAGAQFCSRCGGALNPVSAPTAAAARPLAVAEGVPIAPAVSATYGGFWIRVVAAIVDGIIVRVVVFPVAAIFGSMGLLANMGSPFPHMYGGLSVLGGGISLILIVGASWLYEAFLLSSPYQATLGKMIFGMRVVDLNGYRISFARATGRHFAKWISAMFLGIGFIMAGLTQRKQGLHDILAGTLVQRN